MQRLFYVMTMILAAAPFARAQTNDHLYRSWRWEEDLSAPRPAGLLILPGFLGGARRFGSCAIGAYYSEPRDEPRGPCSWPGRA